MAGGEGMSKVSTHVLDIARGTPASGVAVSLDRQEGPDRWRKIGAGSTDQDGRCAQLVPVSESLSPGTYRLTFDTGAYHGDNSGSSLYPFVQVAFRVAEGETSFHIPLLLGPYGYTTYRGS
jgi:5-hydroxyisourate hydrolase